MPLILHVQSYRSQPAAPGLAGCFGAAGGTLGRAAGNELVLDDPGKYISRTHASVSLRDGAYYLRDTGSNPSIINDRPLGHGREIALGTGDRLVIGEYLLLAELVADAAPPEPVAAPAAAPLPLFVPPAPPVVAPLPPLEAPVAPTPRDDLRGVLPDALAGARILSGASLEGGLDGAGPLADPLGLNLFGGQGGAALPPAGLFDLAHGERLAPAFRGAESDHVSPEFQAFAVPPPAPVSAAAPMMIPDDYDPLADLMAPRARQAAAAPAAMPTLAPAAIPATMPPPVSAPAPAFGAVPESAMAPPQTRVPAAAIAVAPAPDLFAIPPALADGAAASLPLPPPTATAAAPPLMATPLAAALPAALPPALPPVEAAPAAPPPASAVAATPAAAARGPSAGVADGAVLQALLDGLGLPQLRSSRDPEALARLAGEMLRSATGGTMEVLMARALTKRESNIDMTMIAPRSNNPLKFFPDPDSALTQMLGSETRGYLPPVQAIAGAFDDLKAHELAVIAGMRAALGAVVQRFDPARIEQRLAEPGKLDRLMPSARKARMWERLVELYGELARDADEDLQRLFGEKFSLAYEEQVERLRAGR